MEDFYAVLGVDGKAGPEELRRAYLALAVKYHPDRNPGNREAEERFKSISQAYAILSDPAARAKYERLRSRPAAGSAPNGRSASGSGAGEGGRPRAEEKPAAETVREAQKKARPEAAFDEVLNSFFASPQGRQTLRGLEEELAKAGFAFKAEEFSRWFMNGPAARAGTDISPTRRPGLFKRFSNWLLQRGAAAFSRREAEADIVYRLPLTPVAAASGTAIEISYLRDGASRRLAVKVPAGLADGARLRLKGQGHQRPDRSRGDLILDIIIN